MGERVHLVCILFGVFYFGARTFYYWLFFSENLFYSVHAIFYGFQFMVCYLALVSPDFFWGDSPLLSII